MQHEWSASGEHFGGSRPLSLDVTLVTSTCDSARFLRSSPPGKL